MSSRALYFCPLRGQKSKIFEKKIHLNKEVDSLIFSGLLYFYTKVKRSLIARRFWLNNRISTSTCSSYMLRSGFTSEIIWAAMINCDLTALRISIANLKFIREETISISRKGAVRIMGSAITPPLCDNVCICIIRRDDSPQGFIKLIVSFRHYIYIRLGLLCQENTQKKNKKAELLFFAPCGGKNLF